MVTKAVDSGTFLNVAAIDGDLESYPAVTQNTLTGTRYPDVLDIVFEIAEISLEKQKRMCELQKFGS